MICWKILTFAVLSAEANHETVFKREIVQYNDGLFYHEGPYVSHHQYERQAIFVDSRPAPVVNTVFPNIQIMCIRSHIPDNHNYIHTRIIISLKNPWSTMDTHPSNSSVTSTMSLNNNLRMNTFNLNQVLTNTATKLLQFLLKINLK